MAIEMEKLPYEMNALEPHISSKTFEFHYGKHYKTYVDKANAALSESSELNQLSAEELIKKVDGGLFNNVAQAWNHAFYWKCMGPNAGGAPQGKIGDLIQSSFGSFDKFKEDFNNKGATLFGSGWVWLVNKSGKLEILQGKNADCPIKDGLKPVMTCDVWEHAYYLDYQNARPKYLESFWNLVNWKFVESQL